jgi:pyrroline-5-carboxylate reductase
MTSLLVIGGGNMGAAILRGGVAKGLLAPARVCIIEPDAAKHQEFTALGAACHTELALGAEWWRNQKEAQVLLAVKPQMLNTVAERWKACGLHAWSGIIITILAGVPGARVREALGPGTRIVRAMPNLPAAIGEGATALCASAGARREDAVFAQRLFAGIGPVVVQMNEEMIDAFTACAGSGPAYVFALAEAMQAAAQWQGFDAATARGMVVQTIKGAALMMERSDEAAAELRARVTSKGGTTEAALAAMMAGGFASSISEGMDAALRRAGELAKV